MFLSHGSQIVLFSLKLVLPFYKMSSFLIGSHLSGTFLFHLFVNENVNHRSFCPRALLFIYLLSCFCQKEKVID